MKNPVKKGMDKVTRPATHKDKKKESKRGYKKHKGDEPSDPEVAYIDADILLFAAASSAEQVYYVYKDKDGNEVARFKDAKSGKNWLEKIEEFGYDPDHDYSGDVEDLVRETEYEIGDFQTALKNFKSLVNKWFKMTGADKFLAFVSSNTGGENFRHRLATVTPYKRGRDGLRKPHYLEQLRKEVAKLDYVNLPEGDFEVDDVVCGLAQRLGPKAVAVAGDKDVRQVVNCWYQVPDEMPKPVFSDPSHVGVIGIKGKGSKAKIIGMGDLFLLSQVLTGDKADTYDGCKGIGVQKAFAALQPYLAASRDRFPELVKTVCNIFESTYGWEYQYEHCKSGELIDASWKDIMIEQVRLAYMLKSRSDYPNYITDIIEEYYIENKKPEEQPAEESVV